MHLRGIFFSQISKQNNKTNKTSLKLANLNITKVIAVKTSPTSETITPIYVTTSIVVRNSTGGGLGVPVLADMSYNDTSIVVYATREDATHHKTCKVSQMITLT